MTLIVISPETLDAVLDKAQALESARLRSLTEQPRRGRTRDEFGGEEMETMDELSATANGNCPRCTNSIIC